MDPRHKVGCIVGVIYLFHQTGHYWTIEEDPQPAPQPPALGRGNSSPAYSEQLGSIHTDREHDVTYDYDKPIRVDGEEYDARDLCDDGCSLGDGTRLVMRPSDDGEEWIISKVYVQGSSGILELRRLPRKVKQGPSKTVKKDVPLTSRTVHELDADPTPAGVQRLASAFSQQDFDATPTLAQRLYEVMTHYVEVLELHRDEAEYAHWDSNQGRSGEGRVS